jgi:CheY-like chemotaxis protein
VISAFNGKDAREKVKTSQPDAIVLDMIMPEMDGFQVAPAASFSHTHGSSVMVTW